MEPSADLVEHSDHQPTLQGPPCLSPASSLAEPPGDRWTAPPVLGCLIANWCCSFSARSLTGIGGVPSTTAAAAPDADADASDPTAGAGTGVFCGWTEGAAAGQTPLLIASLVSASRMADMVGVGPSLAASLTTLRVVSGVGVIPRLSERLSLGGGAGAVSRSVSESSQLCGAGGLPLQ